MRRRHLVVPLLASIAVVGMAAAQPSTAGTRTAVAHRANGVPVAAGDIPRPLQFLIPHAAGEPTIGITKEGFVAITAGAGCLTSCLGQVSDMLRGFEPGGQSVWITKDKGRHWLNISPNVASVGTHPASQDPYLFVDNSSETPRIFDIDLNLACNEISYSNDYGKTWISNPLACGEPVNDHQTVFSGKPITSPTLGYPKIIYYCFNKVAYSDCTKSLNGGLTWIPTANDSNQLPCSGLNGHGVTDKNGWIYLPYTGCSNHPTLAISKDEASTWHAVQLPGTINGGDPSVAVDAKGNIYYLYDDSGRQPVLTVSTNHGKSWSKPINVAAPGVKYTNLATLAVGEPGRVAIAYYGTTSDSDHGAHTFWNGYLAEGINVLSANPLFYSATINDPNHPLKSQACGPGRCGRVLDFIDVKIAPDGHPWGAYVDACAALCEKTGVDNNSDNQGVVGTLIGGLNLLR